MMARPARYSAALAGSSGWAGNAPGLCTAWTAVSVITEFPCFCDTRGRGWPGRKPSGIPGWPDGAVPARRDLLVGDDRADPLPEAGVAAAEDDAVNDGDDDDGQGRVREPVVGLGLARLGEVIHRHGDRDQAQERQDHVLD